MPTICAYITHPHLYLQVYIYARAHTHTHTHTHTHKGVECRGSGTQAQRRRAQTSRGQGKKSEIPSRQLDPNFTVQNEYKADFSDISSERSVYKIIDRCEQRMRCREEYMCI